jgi:hypothetical protein
MARHLTSRAAAATNTNQMLLHSSPGEQLYVQGAFQPGGVRQEAIDPAPYSVQITSASE